MEDVLSVPVLITIGEDLVNAHTVKLTERISHLVKIVKLFAPQQEKISYVMRG